MKNMKAFFNWSGGKDAAFALYQVIQDREIPVERLLTTVGEKTRRVAMHSVREDLIQAQAAAIGLPLDILYLPEQTSMDTYESRLLKRMEKYYAEGFTTSIFGDINLLDLREYREHQLKKAGITASFPLWDMNTYEQAKRFIDVGFNAIVVSVNANLMDASFVGVPFDHDFLANLPPTVDPCGENGEFHTFVNDGPIFSKPIQFQQGEKVFWEYPSDSSKPGSRYALWQVDLM